MILEKRNRTFEFNNEYLYIGITILITSLVFFAAVVFEHEIYTTFNVGNFLVWHTLLEFLSVIFAYIIFNNSYHSYKHQKRMRLLVLAITFFIVGGLDFLHALSFEGMPNTFGSGSKEMSVIYWIVARLIMAIGIFIAAITPRMKKVRLNERYILFLSTFLTFILFYIVINKAESISALFIDEIGLTLLKVKFEYIVMALQIAAISYFMKEYRATSNKYLMIICSGLIFMTFSEVLFTLYRNMFDTFNLLGHIYKTVGFYFIYYSIFGYNIELPYTKLKDAQSKIELYANNLEKIVDMRTKDFRDANEKLNLELDYAKVIQQSLLPPNRMNFENIVFRSEYIPCEKLSGDFYDIFKVDKDNIGMYILDVTGHGVPAALLTMFSINNIKSNEKLIKRYRGLKPHKNLQHFYDQFNKLSFPDEMHIVTFFASYNIKNKVLTYCSAGMNCYPILIRRTGEYEFLDKSEGFPICQFSHFFTPVYESAKIQLEKGDKIIFYTDGLVEMQKNSLLNEEELINILRQNKNNNIEELNKAISKKLKKVGQVFDDDITYFILEVL